MLYQQDIHVHVPVMGKEKSTQEENMIFVQTSLAFAIRVITEINKMIIS